jgi:hypothetical protein
MKHFLITRFNLKNEHWKHTKSGQQVITEEWLHERFRLFETYCFPSVENQTNQKFYWCILFDTQTPSVYKEKIEHIATKGTNIYPLFIDGFKSLQSALIEFITSQLNKNDKYIITTRLDNDDIIHKDFIDTIQSLSVQKDKTIIDLIEGYQVSINNKETDLRAYRSQYNPFISLVESVRDFKTVISKDHNDWKSLDNIITYDSKPMWIQLIHKGNLTNDKIKALKKVSNLHIEEFGLDKLTFDNPNSSIVLYNTLMIPYRIYYRTKIYLKERLLGK